MKRTWTQRDGTKIKIRDMEMTHLANAARMILRQCDAEVIRLGYFADSLQGEMAQECAAREIDMMIGLCGSELVAACFGEDSEAYAVVVASEIADEEAEMME